MLNVILNEKKIIDDFDKNYVIPENIKSTTIVGLLIKKYHLEKKEKQNIYKKIMKDLKQVYNEDFIYTKWNKIVKSRINKFYKNKGIYKKDIKINNIKKIIITKNELNKISKLNNLILEKIAFIMLVYAKISKIQNQQKNSEYWVNESCTTICQEAKVALRGEKQKKMIHKLYQKKYIDMSNINTKTNIKINYVDENNINDKKNLIIIDFDEVIYQYLIWKGQKWKRCKECNKWIRINSINNKQKYCASCARKMQLEKYKRYNKKRNK